MKTKRKGKAEIKETKSGKQKGAWRYTIMAGNGEKLVTGEGYTSKEDAERGLLALTNAVLDILGDRIMDWARRHI